MMGGGLISQNASKGYKSNEDIVIYTNPKVLKHKQDEDNLYCWWDFGKFPKKLGYLSRVYFAVKGKVVGSFDINVIEEDRRGGRIYFESKTWRPIKEKVTVKAFRGFRYKWWKPIPRRERE